MNDIEVNTTKLYRDENGVIKPFLNKVESYTFQENPFDFFIMLARYKFAAKILKDTNDVIEVGCGHGFGSVFLSKFVKNLSATDIDHEYIVHNKNNFTLDNVQFEVMDLLNIEKDKINKFNGLCSLDVIEHFEEIDIPKVVKSYYSLLKTNGIAIIGTPNRNSQEYASERRKQAHPYEFTYQKFKNSLEEEFENVFIFSMTDEVVSTSFSELAWYFMAVCIKGK